MAEATATAASDQAAQADKGAGAVPGAGGGDTGSGHPEQAAQDTGKAAGAPTTTADDEADFATDDDSKALYAKLDPETRKHLNRVFTQKTQTISAHKTFIEAFQKDPERALQAVAEELGFSVAKAVKDAADAADKGDAGAATKVRDLLEKALGKDQAEALLPALTELVKQETAPLRDHQEKAITQAATQVVEQAYKDFETAHPDWKQHEKKMEEFGVKFRIGEGVNVRDYLEDIYFLATRDSSVAAGVKDTVERMKGAAAASEPRSKSASDAQVAPEPPQELPTIEQSFKAAMKGVVWKQR
jgi:hypothetical protein